MKMRALVYGVSLFGISLFAGACTGSIDTPSEGTPSVLPGSEIPVTPEFTPAATGKPQGTGPRPLSRLTRERYENSVSDLLGVDETPEPVKRFTSESIGEAGFIGVLPAVSTLDARVYLEAAEAYARLAQNQLATLAPCDANTDEQSCATAFIGEFAKRAYRRPLEANEAGELLAVYQEGRTIGYDHERALGMVIQAVLQSPFFLYQWELGANPPQTSDGLIALTSHEVASRLSYLLWHTLPDAELMAAADAGQLTDPAAVASQVRRLLGNSERASSAIWDFYVQWLYVKSPNSLSDGVKKNPELFPEFNEEVKTSMFAEARGFLDAVVLSGSGLLSELATSNWSIVDEQLAPLYGLPSPEGDALSRQALPAGERSGLFTQPLFLASLSSDGGTLPPRMGNTLWTRMLCGPMAAVPADVPPPDPPAPNVTTRERFAQHSESPCAGCHRMLDPLGFAFENYDAIGRYRTMEGDQPIDSSGSVTLPSGEMLTFSNAVDLLGQMSNSNDFKRCFSDQWLRYSLGRRLLDTDAGTPASVFETFDAAGLDIRELIVALATSKAFLFRTVSDGEVTQ